MTSAPVYLDHAATTPTDESAILFAVRKDAEEREDLSAARGMIGRFDG